MWNYAILTSLKTLSQMKMCIFNENILHITFNNKMRTGPERKKDLILGLTFM